MKIFGVYHYVFNGCDDWDSLFKLFLNEDDAISLWLSLEILPKRFEEESWSVREIEVY